MEILFVSIIYYVILHLYWSYNSIIFLYNIRDQKNESDFVITFSRRCIGEHAELLVFLFLPIESPVYMIQESI